MQWWKTRLSTHTPMPSGGQTWIPIRGRIPASDRCTLPGSSSVWWEILASSAGSCTCPDTLPDVWTTKLSQGWYSLSSISSEPTFPGLCRNSGALCGTQASIFTISPILGQGQVHRGKVCFCVASYYMMDSRSLKRTTAKNSPGTIGIWPSKFALLAWPSYGWINSGGICSMPNVSRRVEGSEVSVLSGC